ncbi:MAG: hypothetical protein U0X91_19175 [Spirosomataceae bacterium]
MRKILFVGLMAMIIAIGQVMAQDRTLSDTGKDEAGRTAPGINILLKGTNRGTNPVATTSFKLSVSASGIVVISSVDHETKEAAFS